MDTSNEERTLDPGAGPRLPNYVFVRIGAGDGRVGIYDQDERMVLDFLKDDRIANKIASAMNRRKHGVPEDSDALRTQ